MEIVSNTFSILLLHVLWKINVVYDRYFGIDRSTSKEVPPSPILTKPLQLQETESKGIISDPFLEHVPYSHVYIPLTAVEEEMVKFSCAKGYSSENTFSEKLRDYEDEIQIPRSIFTAMWIESCVGCR